MTVTHETSLMAVGLLRVRRKKDSARPITHLRSGSTLIELVISLSVGVIICGVSGSLLWNAARQRAETAARSELADTAASAVEVFVRYVREIPQDECPGNPTPCLLGNAQISQATASQLLFGTTGFRFDSTNRRLEISSNGGTSWQILCTDVDSCLFSYFNRVNASLVAFPLNATNRAAIRRITIDLQLSRSTETAHLRTSIYLRNFMNEVATDAGA